MLIPCLVEGGSGSATGSSGSSSAMSGTNSKVSISGMSVTNGSGTETIVSADSFTAVTVELGLVALKRVVGSWLSTPS